MSIQLNLQEKIKEHLSYNRATGEFLWKRGGKGTRGVGSVAGNINNGKSYIVFEGKSYLAANLAHLICYGQLPSNTIRYLDGNCLNNAIHNLEHYDLSSLENGYVVYTHTDSSGCIRYVGSGRLERAYYLHARSGRGEKYRKFVEDNGRLKPNIIFQFSSERKARESERALYNDLARHGLLLNKKQPCATRTVPPVEFLMSTLEYDESSPSCLRRKNSKKIAGCLSKNSGNFVVSVNGAQWRAHRIIVALHGIPVPDDKVVDHIDGNPSNNKISNLRVVSQAENMRNMKVNKTDGLPIGVKFNKNKNSYTATVKHPTLKTKSGYSKSITQEYKISEYGEELALSNATAARAEMLSNLEITTGVSYSEKHR